MKCFAVLVWAEHHHKQDSLALKALYFNTALCLRSVNEPKALHFAYITYLLTYSMVQSSSWEANWFAASQEIPRISRNPKVHYRTHKRLPPVSILGQPNPVHIPTSHLLEIHPNIIHPSMPRSPQWSSLRFPQQDPIHPPLLTHTCHMPSPSHFANITCVNTIGIYFHFVFTLWYTPLFCTHFNPQCFTVLEEAKSLNALSWAQFLIPSVIKTVFFCFSHWFCFHQCGINNGYSQVAKAVFDEFVTLCKKGLLLLWNRDLGSM